MAVRPRVMSKELPEELVVDILVRLPPKSLMRFKCVRRSWDDLFKDRNFVAKHLLFSSLQEYLMVFQDIDDENPHQAHHNRFSIKELAWDYPSLPPQDVPFPLADTENSSYFLPYGPCNGIFFLFVSYNDHFGQLMLWNPATREVKVIPPPNILPPCYDWQTTSLSFGFGIDPNSNDYKVVSLMLRDSVMSVQVFSFSTNSWTLISDASAPFKSEVSTVSTYANGVCYWMSGWPGNDRTILCFDLSKNQFRELTVPVAQVIRPQGHGDNEEIIVINPHFHGVVDRPMAFSWIGYDYITEVNDSSIAYVALHADGDGDRSRRNNYKLEIWILNDDGVEGNWAKVFNKELLGLETRVFGFWNGDGNGNEFLVVIKDVPLMSYNTEWEPVRHFQIDSVLSVIRILKYVRSIVPLSV